MDSNCSRQTGSERSYIKHLLRHRRVWDTKASVRVLYRHWYRMIVGELAELSPSVELGCGCGNFKEYYPEVIATDSFETPWCDRVVDACNSPFEDASVGNLVLFDVLHHIPTPLGFFSEASRVLMPGGRIVIVDPFISAWSWGIYNYGHHEPFDMKADFLSGQPQPLADSPEYANAATATILFKKRYQDFAGRLPQLRRVTQRTFSWLAYPLTGGLQPFCLIPAFAVVPLSRLEDFFFSKWKLGFLAMKMLVTLEKTV